MNILRSIVILIIVMSETLADSIFKDNFQNFEKWSFVSDKVMGGVSSGNVEFLPFENFFNKIGLRPISNKIESFSKGDIRKILEIGNEYPQFKFLPLICYEIIYSGNLTKSFNFDFILKKCWGKYWGNLNVLQIYQFQQVSENV